MANETDTTERGWGHCAHCKFFGQHGAEDRTANLEERRCMEPELSQFDLVVTGSAGCNHFEKGAGVPVEVEEPASPPTFPGDAEQPVYH